MTYYKDLEYFNRVILDNCTTQANRINQTDVYQAIEILEHKLTKHVFHNCIDEYAILMQELRSQLKILLCESLEMDYSEEQKRLEYITSINILYEESKGSSQS